MSWWESAPLADENKGDWWSSAPLADDAKQDLPKRATPVSANSATASVDYDSLQSQVSPEFETESAPQEPQSRRVSVLEGRYMPEPQFNAQEAQRLSRRDYVDQQQRDAFSKQSLRPSNPQKPTLTGRIAGNLENAPLPARALGKAALGAAQGTAGLVRAAGELTGVDSVAEFAKGAAQAAQSGQEAIGEVQSVEGFGPRSPVPYLGRMAEGAAQSLGASVATGLAFGPGAILPTMFAGSAGRAYDDGRNAGLEPGAALARAATYGAFEVAGEKFQGLDKAVGALGTLMMKGASTQAKRDASADLIRAGVREVPGELFTYIGQTGTDLMPGIGINPNLTTGQFLDGMRDTVVQSAMMGGALGVAGAASRNARTNRPAIGEQMPARIAPRVEDQPSVPTVPEAPSVPAQTVPDIMRAAADIAPTATNTGAADRVAAILNLEQIQGTPDAASPLPNAPAGQAIDEVPAGLASAGGAGNIDTGTSIPDGAGQGGLNLPLGAGQSGGEFSGNPVSLAAPRATELDQRQAPQAAPSQEPAPMAGNAAGRPVEPTATASAPVESAGVKRDPASWVIKEKATGNVIMETFDKKKVSALNTAKYEAVPITDYLVGMNKEIKDKKVTRLGINNIDIAEGGKPFKTKKEADKARKNQPMMRTLRTREGGYILADKTPAQLASEAERARKMALPSVGKKGKPMAAHEFIASEGGLNSDADAEIGFGRNPKIGNRTLYAKKGSGKGLTLSQAAEKLWQNGYSNEELSETQVAEMMKRGFERPTYTAEGFDRIAQAETETRFEDYMAAQVETQNSEFDPFPLPENYTSDIRDESGYDDATQQQTRELEALIAQADAEGIDTDSIKDRFAQQENLTDEEYRAAIRAEVANQRTVRANSANPDRREDSQQGRQDAIGRVSPDSGQPNRAESAQGNEPEGLTSPTREDILSQQDRAENAQALDEKAQIDREARGFALQAQTQDIRKDNTSDMFGGPSVADFQAAAQRKPAGAANTGPDLFNEEPAQQSEETNLLALSRNQEKPGDVMLGNGRFASFDDTVRVAKVRIAAGEFKPTPSQLTFHMDLSQRDVDRVAEALNAPVAPPEPAPRPPATVVELRKRVAVLKKLKGCLA